MGEPVQQLAKSILTCSKCPLMIKSGIRPVPGYGKDNSNIMLVGLAPGKDGADMTGIPFTRDPSGLLLTEMLQNAGISRELDVFITNIVKCNPRDEKGRNRPPSRKELSFCWPYLKKEINIIKPKLIISLGKSASDYLIRERSKSMSDIHGKVYKLDNRIVVPFIHPGYVIRGAYDRNKYIKEFSLIGKLYRQLIEKESKLNRFDFILMILKNSGHNRDYGKIIGKTRLQKYVFLAQDMLKNGGYKAKYAFRPYYYGPFNRQLYTDVEWMRINGLIEITSELSSKGQISSYKITEKGLTDINRFVTDNDLEDVECMIRDTITAYHHYDLPSLLEYVHREYEEYHLKPIQLTTEIKITKLDEFLISKEI